MKKCEQQIVVLYLINPGLVDLDWHLGILSYFPEITMLLVISMANFIQKKFFSDHSFAMVIPDRQEWMGEGHCFEDNYALVH